MAHPTPHRSLPTRNRGWGHGTIPIELAVSRHDRRLRSVARSFGLGPWDVDDVVQTTWLQFIEHGHELRERAALGAWLETTARRLSLRLLQRHVREQLTDDPGCGAAAEPAEPAAELIAAERREALHGALAELPDRQRQLMRTLLLHPHLSYEEVGRQLAMPIGSIGPTRARCMERLRVSGRLRALQAGGPP